MGDIKPYDSVNCATKLHDKTVTRKKLCDSKIRRVLPLVKKIRFGFGRWMYNKLYDKTVMWKNCATAKSNGTTFGQYDKNVGHSHYFFVLAKNLACFGKYNNRVKFAQTSMQSIAEMFLCRVLPNLCHRYRHKKDWHGEATRRELAYEGNSWHWFVV